MFADHFSHPRLLNFIKLEWIIQKKAFFISLSLPFMLWTLVLLYKFSSDAKGLEWYDSLFSTCLVSGLWGYTSRIFDTEHSPIFGPQHILLPVSLLENIVAKTILTLIMYFFAALLFGTILSNSFEFLAIVQNKKTFKGLLLPEASKLFSQFKNFYFWHSIFFCGAIFFKKSAAIKTLFVLLLMTLVAGISAIFFVGSLPSPQKTIDMFINHLSNENSNQFTLLNSLLIPVTLFFYLVTYKRLSRLPLM